MSLLQATSRIRRWYWLLPFARQTSCTFPVYLDYEERDSEGSPAKTRPDEDLAYEAEFIRYHEMLDKPRVWVEAFPYARWQQARIDATAGKYGLDVVITDHTTGNIYFVTEEFYQRVIDEGGWPTYTSADHRGK